MAYQNQQPSVKTLRIIFFGLLAGQCLFLLVTLFITQNKGINFNTAADPLIIVAPLMAVMAIVVGPVLSNKVLAGAANKETVKEKLTVYQTAFIQRAALLEGSCLLSIVSYMLSGNLFFAIVAGVLILTFLTIYPTDDKIATALNLSTTDLQTEPA